MAPTTPKETAVPRRRWSLDVLFDLRTIIGVLFAVYGVVCLVLGLASFTAADQQRAGGFNVNLWAGVGMLVLAAGFLAWSLLRPVVVDRDAAAQGAPDPRR